MRLNADIALRLPPSGNEAVTVAGGWFPLAAKYSGAIARVERLDQDGRPAGVQSGFLITGSLVRGNDPHAYLLAPAFRAPRTDAEPNPFRPPPGQTDVAGQDGVRADGSLDRMAEERPQMTIWSDAPPAGLSVTFPVLGDEAALTGARHVWKTPDHLGGIAPFELWALNEALPFGARPLEAADVSCAPLKGREHPENAPGRALALYGIGDTLQGGGTVTLFLSALIRGDDPYAIHYEHSTTLGSMGAPVFDLESGKVTGVHLGSLPAPGLDRPRTGYGLSLALVLEGIRQEIAIEGYEGLGVLCGD